MRREVVAAGWGATSLGAVLVWSLLSGCSMWVPALGSIAVITAAAGAAAVLWLRRARACSPAREVSAAARALRALGEGEAPWVLVTGAPGAGKSAALAAGGCTVLALPDARCRWWRGAGAVFIEPPASWGEEEDGQWMALLRALRRRHRPALAAVIAVVSLPHALGLDEAALTQAAERLRRRLADAARRLDQRLPVWLLLTRADQVAGCKEALAAAGAAERRAAWGSLLPLDSAAGVEPALQAIVSAAQARRLAAVRAARDDEGARKAYAFPGQVAAATRWMRAFAEPLAAAGPSGAPLRAIHLASAALVGGRQALLAPASCARSGAGTITLDTRGMRIAPALPSSAEPAGTGLRCLLTEDIPADAGSARPSTAASRRGRCAAAAWRIALPGICGLLAILLAASAWHTVALAHAARYPMAKARDAAGASVAQALTALEPLAPSVAAAADAALGGRLAEALAREYIAGLQRPLLQPCLERVRADLAALRADATASDRAGRLDELLRAYRMLGGELAAEPALMERVLLAEERWGPAVGTDPEARASARRHVSFLLLQPRTLRAWRPAIDRHLVSQVEHELAEELWPRAAFDAACDAVAGSYAPVTRDVLVTGPFRDVMDAPAGFAGVFTQPAWDASVRALLRDQADAVSERVLALGMPARASEIATRLESRFADEHQRRWLGLLASTRLRQPMALRDVPAALAILAGAQSPWRELAEAVASRQAVRRGISLVQPRPDVAWLTGAQSALATLASHVQRYVAAGAQTGATVEPRRVREVLDGVETAWQACCAATAAIDEPQGRAAATASAQGILASVVAAIGEDALAACDRLWVARVHRPFADRLSGTFPFDPEATRDAPIDAVSALLNPVDGSLWSIAGPIEELRVMRAAGRQLLDVSTGYDALRTRALALRSALFPDGGQRVATWISASLRLREGVRDVRLAVGATSAGCYDRPDGRSRFAWGEAVPATAKLSLTAVTGQVLTTEIADGPWALVRLLRSGQPTRRAAGGWLCTWTFDAAAIGRDARFRADAVIDAAGAGDALAAGWLHELTCPASIAP